MEDDSNLNRELKAKISQKALASGKIKKERKIQNLTSYHQLEYVNM